MVPLVRRAIGSLAAEFSGALLETSLENGLGQKP
jgi:hypothetical protein